MNLYNVATVLKQGKKFLVCGHDLLNLLGELNQEQNATL